MKRFALIFALMLVPLISLAESSGDNNGKPFLELQAAVDAALAAEAGAREAADAAEASERKAADSAESSTRAAEDAALSVRIAVEEAARIADDIALQAQINAHDALLLDLDDRVSILEGLHLVRSVTWTETAGTFDVTDIAADIAGLNYQLGEWMFFVSSNAANGREFGNCTNQTAVSYWLNAAVAGTSYSAGYSGSGSYFFANGSWYNSPTTYIATYNSGYPYALLRVNDSGGNLHFVIDRKGNPSDTNYEVYSGYSGGYGIGNTLTINVASTRLGACGF